MKPQSVSGVWEDLLKEDGAYSAEGAGKGLFQRALSSRWISSLLKEGSNRRFLEAGCGLGRFGISIAAAGRDVTLMDCSDNSLNDAKSLNRIAENYFGRLKVNFVKDDLEHTKFEDNRFDVTFNEGVVEHWLDHEARIKIIKEMARITRPGGLVSIRVVNNKNSLYNFLYLITLHAGIPMHHRYNLKELRQEMADAGLDIIYCDGEAINDPGNWVRNVPLSRLFILLSIVINKFPKFLRQKLCPSIFCSGIVRKQIP